MNFMQDTYANAISSFAQASNQQNFIVSGVDISAERVVDDEIIQDVADGFIVLDGEFMEFRGGRMYPNREETSFVYVVKKREARTNENSNGQLVEAFEVTYATLGNEEGGVLINSMERAKFILPCGSFQRAIEIDERLRELTQDEAEDCGICANKDTSEAKPICYVSGNIVYMKGAVTHTDKDNSPFNDDVAVLGSIPDWIGRGVYVKCLFEFSKRLGQRTIGPGSVYIQESGHIQFPTRGYKTHITKVIFDGTPTFII